MGDFLLLTGNRWSVVGSRFAFDASLTHRFYPLPQEGGAGGLGEEAAKRARLPTTDYRLRKPIAY